MAKFTPPLHKLHTPSNSIILPEETTTTMMLLLLQCEMPWREIEKRNKKKKTKKYESKHQKPRSLPTEKSATGNNTYGR
jgi:hypothetical protein